MIYEFMFKLYSHFVLKYHWNPRGLSSVKTKLILAVALFRNNYLKMEYVIVLCVKINFILWRYSLHFSAFLVSTNFYFFHCLKL